MRFAMAGNKWWSSDEDSVLKEHFKWIPSGDLSEVLDGRTKDGINERARRLGLKKAHEVRQEVGRTNANVRYKKP